MPSGDPKSLVVDGVSILAEIEKIWLALKIVEKEIEEIKKIIANSI